MIIVSSNKRILEIGEILKYFYCIKFIECTHNIYIHKLNIKINYIIFLKINTYIK